MRVRNSYLVCTEQNSDKFADKYRGHLKKLIFLVIWGLVSTQGPAALKIDVLRDAAVATPSLRGQVEAHPARSI